MPRVTFLCQACEAWTPMERHHEESGEVLPLLGAVELERPERPEEYSLVYTCDVGHELCDACADHPCGHPACRADRAFRLRRRLERERGEVHP